MTAYERSKTYSNERLELLRNSLSGKIPDGEVVLTCGSFARREASEQSDIDFFVITGLPSLPAEFGKDERLDWVETVKSEINNIVPTEPSAGGAFSKVEYRDSMLQNIGGESDSNQKITRRMLFLLEGEWLYNEEGLRAARRDILERYIGTGISDRQLALFLLNDIIRYYRTIAVDYEYKTSEGAAPKPWGIRNIKLTFSRKLLYASGLFSVGMTANLCRERKIKLLEELFDMPVIERMRRICGEFQVEALLASYDCFLNRIEAEDVRQHLNQLSKNERNDPIFRELKNEGHRFTGELLKLFDRTFDRTHPIHRAVIF